MNAAGLAILCAFEHCSLKAYFDVNGYACGWGTHGPNITKDTVWTQEQADAARDEHIASVEAELDHMITVPITDNQKAAVTDLAYNVGVGALAGTKTLEALNAGEYEAVSNMLLLWDIVQGKPNAELAKRRAAERQLFLTPDPV